ncbi:STAS domain-containing protein [Streptomyces lavendulocolor]|uniref:STAS domain-containing protein n=1 Tax=Streptomyces lavendulocolor TaxID=67316 RepID=UPI0033E53E1B
MDGHPVAVLPDEDGVRVIVCRGEFDLDTRAPLIAADEAAMADPAVRRIILDMSNVTFADSFPAQREERGPHVWRLTGRLPPAASCGPRTDASPACRCASAAASRRRP